jgi:hypothetical protein
VSLLAGALGAVEKGVLVMPKLTTSEVQALLQGEKSDALSAAESSKLSEERSRAIDYYLGDMKTDMPAPADRSKAVSSDVADTVEGLMPSLMEIFFAGDDVVEFVPTGQEDEEAAQQETDYVNYVFTQKNPGFLVMYSFVKDALLSKNGIVKVYWEDKEEAIEESFWGLPDAAYGLLKQAKGVEIVEHTERLGIPGQQPRDDAQGTY